MEYDGFSVSFLHEEFGLSEAIRIYESVTLPNGLIMIGEEAAQFLIYTDVEEYETAFGTFTGNAQRMPGAMVYADVRMAREMGLEIPEQQLEQPNEEPIFHALSLYALTKQVAHRANKSTNGNFNCAPFVLNEDQSMIDEIQGALSQASIEIYEEYAAEHPELFAEDHTEDPDENIIYRPGMYL